MRYVTGRDERGGPIDVRDPLAADLPTDPAFRAAVAPALSRLLVQGAGATVAAYAA